MSKIKLLGISASPRKKGNSRFLLDKALKGAEETPSLEVETRVVSLAGMKIGPCVSCFGCAKKGDCIIDDDFKEIRDAWLWADAIIYSVPVYHMGVPGQLKCFFDRLGNSLFFLYGGSPVRNMKVVGSVVQGAHLFAGQEQTTMVIINHAVLLGCLPVSGDPWECYIGAAGWTRTSIETDSLKKLDESGEEDCHAAVSGAASVGRRVVQTTALLMSGGMANGDWLAEEPVYREFLKKSMAQA